jgi:hypothetical protein
MEVERICRQSMLLIGTMDSIIIIIIIIIILRQSVSSNMYCVIEINVLQVTPSQNTNTYNVQ